MGKEDISARLDELRGSGHTVYSISRLNSFNTCQVGYYINYVLKHRGGDNVYSLLGGMMHDTLENIHNDLCTEEELIKTVNNGLLKCDLLGLKFPGDKVANAWKLDMVHFANNFKRLPGKFVNEKGFVVNIDGNYFQGFIDNLSIDNNGEVVVLDWKTSAKFSGKKLQEAGRQLILYKLALEQELGVEVNRLAWVMLKYVDVYYDGKKKTVSRRGIVKELKNLINTQMKRMGMSQFEIDMKLQIAIEQNSLDVLPKQVRDRFEIRDCVVWYDVTDEMVQECKEYLSNTIKAIEAMDSGDMDEWSCIDLDNDKDRFFCDNLCAFSKDGTCPRYQEWLER